MNRKEVSFMSLMTGEQYIESIRNLKMNVYMFGKKIDCAQALQ